ncbi:uncharacterized protein AMSG_04229 [Thecamonas trahens ATCC 50062]|uniref:Uncharacterized protein n=1 Tax=Thecamonas trahens ATCC 50062 TaxID=461836 RepID=A0A0L0D6L8_THETB|nr:hypothetical protein AMSG_04229 [Thecamonas trahens ATCC 50062]KNC47994.1 hypothetical protein AMSG_04229 [Thecamonas trahens ATCC 50062]|eukprot:XP_013759011.1 hypothetical protein AMSG_04229 [Thecamonas trahens ATCC 50062]
MDMPWRESDDGLADMETVPVVSSVNVAETMSGKAVRELGTAMRRKRKAWGDADGARPSKSKIPVRPVLADDLASDDDDADNDDDGDGQDDGGGGGQLALDPAVLALQALDGWLAEGGADDCDACAMPVQVMVTGRRRVALTVSAAHLDLQLARTLRRAGRVVRGLSIRGCEHVSDSAIHRTIPELPNLVELSMSGASRVGFSSMRHFARRARSLRIVDVTRTRLEAQGVTVYLKRVYAPASVSVIASPSQESSS